jgi:hypothetical protein
LSVLNYLRRESDARINAGRITGIPSRPQLWQDLEPLGQAVVPSVEGVMEGCTDQNSLTGDETLSLLKVAERLQS